MLMLLYFLFTALLLEHRIDISCFTLMTDDMLKEIIPMIGHRAKFRANLEEWRKVIALANNQVIYQVSNIFLYILLYLEVK